MLFLDVLIILEWNFFSDALAFGQFSFIYRIFSIVPLNKDERCSVKYLKICSTPNAISNVFTLFTYSTSVLAVELMLLSEREIFILHLEMKIFNLKVCFLQRNCLLSLIMNKIIQYCINLPNQNHQQKMAKKSFVPFFLVMNDDSHMCFS